MAFSIYTVKGDVYSHPSVESVLFTGLWGEIKGKKSIKKTHAATTSKDLYAAMCKIFVF